MGETGIYPGRFQPFHEGHAQIIDACLRHVAMLVVAVICDYQPVDGQLDAFDKASEEHFSRERNPWRSTTVLQVVSVIGAARWPNRITATLLPRPSAGVSWDVICALLPGARRWFIPDRGEAWDDEKATFFLERGDGVTRIRLERSASAHAIRQGLAAGEQDVLLDVPVEARSMIRKGLADTGP